MSAADADAALDCIRRVTREGAVMTRGASRLVAVQAEICRGAVHGLEQTAAKAERARERAERAVEHLEGEVERLNGEIDRMVR